MKKLFALSALVLLFAAGPASAAPATQAANIASPLTGVTVAVLPFVNVDGDASQEFVADGMTDEVNLALAQVPGLTPMARISAYRFRGSKDDARTFGRTLGAAHIVEGTARRVGTRIRVSVKLTRVNDGMALWSENYYAEYPEIFDIQNDIARKVATALKLKPGENLVPNRTANMEVYDAYLRARPLIRARGGKPFADAAMLLEPIVAREPNFAPASQLLAFDYDLAPLYNPALRSGQTVEAKSFVASVVPKAEALASRATMRDPKRADAFAALAYAYLVQNKMLSADAAFKQAIALDPNLPDALHGYSQLLAAFGRIKESIAMRKHLQALEPFFINYVADTAEIFWLDGDNDTAITMLDQFRPGRTLEIALIKSSLGRYKEAAAHLREMGQGNYAPGVLDGAARLLEGAPTKASPDAPRLGNLGWIFLFAGAPERTMEYYESNLAAGYFQPISATWFWHPSYAPLRKTERFKDYVRKIGFADVWRASGQWPAPCKPVGANDFACM